MTKCSTNVPELYKIGGRWRRLVEVVQSNFHWTTNGVGRTSQYIVVAYQMNQRGLTYTYGGLVVFVVTYWNSTIYLPHLNRQARVPSLSCYSPSNIQREYLDAGSWKHLAKARPRIDSHVDYKIQTHNRNNLATETYLSQALMVL